jgi:phosphoribosylaminoimidazole carboxylase (NCAIR synthetase)
VLLQQYIKRDYEISILGCGLSSGICLIPAIENKLTLYPKHVGLECLANMQSLEDGPIKKSIENLVSAAGYVGLFSVEMMHCKDAG